MKKLSLVGVLVIVLILLAVTLALSVTPVNADGSAPPPVGEPEIIPIDKILPGQCVGVPGHQICIIFLNIVQKDAIGFDDFGTAGYCIPTRDDPFRCIP